MNCFSCNSESTPEICRRETCSENVSDDLVSIIKQHHWTLDRLCCKCHCKSAMFSVHWGDKKNLCNSYGYGENLSHILISTACPRVHIKKATKAWRNPWTHIVAPLMFAKDPLDDPQLCSVGTTYYRALAHVLKAIKNLHCGTAKSWWHGLKWGFFTRHPGISMKYKRLT